MPSAKYLLIDNSNSFTKLSLAEGDRLTGPRRRVATRTLTAAQVQAAVKGWRYEGVVLSSVVPEKGALIEETLAPAPVLRVSAKIKLGVGIDYPKKQSIGADRLANAACAAALYRPPMVVVDFGTAVSFDIIATGPTYVGGVIAPGLEAMTDYLHERTALLPKIQLLEPPGPIGKSTKHAMMSGAVYGYRGLVRGILEELRKELKVRKLHVIATGGYADLIAAGLPEISAVEPDLTLHGLRVVGELNAAGPR